MGIERSKPGPPAIIRGKIASRVDLPANTLHYYFNDHLGTTSVVTSAAGVVQKESDYFPYGGEIAIVNSDANRYKFAGKERDAESSLDYFGARYYASSVGRFMTPDPVMVSWRRMVNPQIWNMYSYVANNPLKFVDPLGEELIELGQHTDKEIDERTKVLKEGLKNTTLTKDQKQSLKGEIKTLSQEKEGNKVVGNMLTALDHKGELNGMKLSDFTLTTDTKNDFAGILAPAVLREALTKAAFVLQRADGPGFGGTIFVRTEVGFYPHSQTDSDYSLFGGAALRHEQRHVQIPGHERDAYQLQDKIFHLFQNDFQNRDTYDSLDRWLHETIKNQTN